MRWNVAPYATAALMLVYAGMTGCGGAESPRLDEAPGSACRNNTECGTGEMCRSGFCTVTGAQRSGISFQFEPRNDSKFHPQVARGFTARTDQSLDFALEPSVTVEGTITYQPMDSGPPGPNGTLEFRRLGRDRGLFAPDVTVEGGEFRAQVHPGRYDLRFSKEEFPAVVWKDREIRPPEVPTFEFSVPKARKLAIIQSDVYYTVEGAKGQEQKVLVSNAIVYGIASDKSRSYRTTTNRAEDGGFEIRAIQGTGTYDLVVEPTEDSPLLPTVTFPDKFTADSEVINISDVNLGTYSELLEKEKRPTIGYRLRPADAFRNRDNDDESAIDWEGTVVLATAKFEKMKPAAPGGKSPRRVFWHKAEAGKDGRVDMEILPGATYEISVYPPASSPFETFHFTQDIEKLEDRKAPKLPLKKKVAGRVVDADGEPVKDAKLVFRPLDIKNASHMSNELQRLEQILRTDEKGQFATRLERRDYDVTIKPPVKSGLPRSSERLKRKRIETKGTANPIRFEVPRPFLLRGTVYGDNNETAIPVQEAKVEAFVEAKGGANMLGEATTDDGGRFWMLLPAEGM